MSFDVAHDLIAQRFEVLERVGSGGMGSVFRARDLRTKQLAALKLQHSHQQDEADAERFMQEAEVLATLRHPGIVGYVGHGLMPDGQPYLAMEWLEGEDLEQRLRRDRLSIAEVVTLLTQVGAALEHAHEVGIVHRDLKPSNLFLRDGRFERVAIVDFGISRHTKISRRVTRTGALLGTPDYMAPEQARGERHIGSAVDIFSLGCVAYQCLAGQPPFAAAHIAATLAKILFVEPEPLRNIGVRVPAPLENLIMSMLAKEPGDRPASVAKVLQELSTVTVVPDSSEEVATRESLRMRLAGDEQSLFCVVVVTPRLPWWSTNTVAIEDAGRRTAEILALRQSLTGYDVKLEPLADGSLVVSLGQGHGEATEQVARALQCAQLLRERYPDAHVVLATGRGVGGAGVPIGEAIDRAGRILQELIDDAQSPVFDGPILDEVSASLLRGRYRLERRAAFSVLQGESLTTDPSRPLLGQPTPCVGREPEFSVLDGTLKACIEEECSRAILVTGAPGQGKSRLCHEFMRRIRQENLVVNVWLSACDPFSSGTSYGPVSRALRQLCNVHDGDSIDVKQARLRERVMRNLPAAHADEVVEFLGELCAVHFPDERSVKLRAARQDPRLMADQVTQALLRFLQQECKDGPLLWVLEDLQWCDALTVKAVGVALRQLKDSPLFVLASARPEVLNAFPNLWLGHIQTLPLRPLSRKASERFVQQFLREKVDARAMSQLLERADGNPLWLEELIRTVAEGHQDEPPQTIMAILQARIGLLPSGARQLLRAASVFGETFWVGGISALLQHETDVEMNRLSQMLVERELWVPSASSRYPQQQELRFRHTLMREAAYSLLTEEDRALGHRLAGEFLEQQGESESALIAEHARRGGDLARAILYYSLAAENALARNDVTAALRHAQAGLSCGPNGLALGLLQAIEAMGHHWGGDLHNARAAGLSALQLLPRGSRRWFQAMLAMWLTTTYLGENELFNSLRDDFAEVTPEAGAIHAYVEATSFLVVMTSLVGQAVESRTFLDRLNTETAAVIESDSAIRGWVKYAQGVYVHWIDGDLWQKARLARESINAADSIGDRRLRCLALTSLALAQMGLGIYDAGMATFRQALSEVEQLHGEAYLLGSTTGFFSACLTEREDLGVLDEAIGLAERCVKTLSPTAPSVGLAYISLARAHAMRGELDRAVHFAEKCVMPLRSEPAVFPIACAVLGQVYLAAGRIDEARIAIAEGKDVISKLGSTSYDVVLFFRAAELAHQVGDEAAAHDDLRECARRLARAAARIPDLDVRRNYLYDVPLHAQIIERLSQWVGPQATGALLPDT